jgi:hypothetical protein
MMNKEWVVFSKRPFKSPTFVLDYLGRFTHRVAISNHRIVDISEQRVQFAYKDRKFKGQSYTCQTKICTLEGEAFLQRFLLHELPAGLMRIRHFGFFGKQLQKSAAPTDSKGYLSIHNIHTCKKEVPNPIDAGCHRNRHHRLSQM